MAPRFGDKSAPAAPAHTQTVPDFFTGMPIIGLLDWLLLLSRHVPHANVSNQSHILDVQNTRVAKKWAYWVLNHCCLLAVSQDALTAGLGLKQDWCLDNRVLGL